MYWNKRGIEGICLRIGTVLTRLTEPRHLSTWLGHADPVRLALSFIMALSVGILHVSGVSDNTRSNWDCGGAGRLGYKPLQRSDDFAGDVLCRPNPLDPSAQSFQGGGIVTSKYTHANGSSGASRRASVNRIKSANPFIENNEVR